MRLYDLMESREAPLYHGTGLDVLRAVLRTGELRPNTRHHIDGRPHWGVSLTRNPRYALWWATQEHDIPVVLEIDQRTVAATTRLMPIDIYGDGFLGPSMRRREAEEFALGAISVDAVRTIWLSPEADAALSPRSKLKRDPRVKIARWPAERFPPPPDDMW